MAPNDSTQSSGRRAADAVIISIVFVAIACVFVILRCIARFGLLRICGADDVFILFSLGFSIAFTALIEAQRQNGLGQHIDVLTPDQRVQTLKTFWASVFIYYLGLTAVKSSLLCQYLRFLVGPTIRRVCWIMLFIVLIYGTCTTLGSVLACAPVSKFWDPDNKRGHCINLLAFWFTNASFNIVSDIAIWVLPMPVLKSLQLPPRQKYSLIIVFALGGFACIISAIRLNALYNIARSTDVTWDNVGAAVWSSVEINVGIMCACLPTMKALVTRCLPWLLHSTQVDRVGLQPHSFALHSVGVDSNATEPRSQEVVNDIYWKDETHTLTEAEQGQTDHCCRGHSHTEAQSWKVRDSSTHV